MSTEQLEQRLANLEQAVNRIAEKLDQLLPTNKKLPWWEECAGRFANDPLYKQAAEYGRQYRESLRPEDEDVADGHP
jgi:hypothetical protein